MSKQTIWAALKSAIPPGQVEKINESDLSITLKAYGSVIALKSADNPNSMRGAGLNFVAIDEYSDISPETWTEVLRPALVDRRGEAIICGSPRGFNHLYEMFTVASETPDWAAFKFSTQEGGLVTDAEIGAVRSTLDPVTFGQEFLADFTTSTNRVFLMFSREGNVRSDLGDPGVDVPPLASSLRADPVAVREHARSQGDLLVGLDFNVGEMTAVIAVKAADELHVIDEVIVPNANTQLMAEELKQRYPARKLRAFPDPSGRSRKTSAAAGVTDFTILEQAGILVFAPAASYAVVDKINTVNSLLCSAAGRRRLFIHTRCKRLIRGLEQLPYKEGTNQPDKNQGLDHVCDALGYLAMGIFPLTGTVGTIRVRGV
jgi:hypothetical protein